jgi:HTH-type transcriptional regulator, sugar sensing transcriptional regulator
VLVQTEAVDALVGLGLTVLQAKVYAATSTSGALTARTTAKTAKVASQDVYRILSELQEIGLVERIIAKPNKYRAIPLGEGLEILLQRRKEETEELKKTATKVVRDLGNLNKPSDNNEGDFILIPKKGPVINRIRKAFESAQTSIDLMNNFMEGVVVHELNYEQEMKAVNRNVKIRDLLCKSPEDIRVPESFQALLRKAPNFQAKYTSCDSSVKLLIKDKKEMLISTIPESATTMQPYLWSNNPVLLEIVQQWYDMKWEAVAYTFPFQAKSVPAQEIRKIGTAF